MHFKVLAVGDITGESGVAFLRRHLGRLKQEKGIDFAVVNAENAAGNGLLPAQAEDIFAAGADVITLGNHTFGKMQIAHFLEENPYILRPANYTGRAPGKGWGVYDCGRVQVGVLNLIGRCGLDFNAENPFTTADEHVCPKGTGYITDLGMTGPRESVLGIRPEQSVEFFLGGLPGRYRTAEGACKLQGAIFTLDSGTGLCVGVERIEVL